MKTSMTLRVTTGLLATCAGLVWGPTRALAQVAIQKVQIAEGVYQFISAPDGYVPTTTNSVVIVNENDVLVFDDFARPSTARTELAEIRKITDKPVRYVVNSHHHPDHWSGNEVYAEAFPNLEIIATEESRQYMLSLAKSWPPVWASQLGKSQSAFDKEISTGKQSDGTALTPEQRTEDEAYVRLKGEFVAEGMKVKRTYPTLTYDDHLTLRHGGREFRFMSLVGDASSTTVLYLPKEKILITGDLIVYPLPYAVRKLNQIAKELRMLAQFDADVIIPGHGPAWHDKGFLNLEADLAESIVNQVNEAVENGLVTIEEIQKAVNVEPLRLKFTHDDKELNAEFSSVVSEMVQNAAREARDGREWKR